MKVLVRSAYAALALVLLPAGARSATVDYAPPAGNLPAGAYRGLPYEAVLPSGRLVVPAGTSVVTGTDTLGVALTPDGRYAIASNDDERDGAARSRIDPDASGGYSLTVVDTARMTAVAHYRAPGETFFGGVAAVKDPLDPSRTLVFAAGGASNAVYAFDLDDAGNLTPDAHHRIDVPGPADAAFANRGVSFPSALVASSDGRRVYAVDMSGDSVATIDTAARALSGAPVPVGFTPSGAAVAGSRLLVTNEGLMRYGVLPALAPAPPFAATAPDLADASSLSLLALDAGGQPAASGESVPMDPAPDGVRIAGGAHPTAIVTTADGAYAFVAMTNVDRIATVALGPAPHVAGGTELRLFDRGPYGTQPTALALSHDGSRLYVALSGLDAVAVIDARDPLHLHRLGLIPTGWVPSALALSADDRTLFVANQKGFGDDGGADWSTLERIDLAGVRLADSTRAALGATRRVVALPPPLPAAIRNVVLIVEDGKTYDEVLGDLPAGPGSPALVRYGASVTPNLHALARRFALAGNLYAGSDDVGVAQQIVAGGLATAFAQRTASAGAGRRPLGFESEDPEDAPRLGDVFNALARHGLSFRDYGGFLGVSGTAVAAPGAPAGLGAAFGQDVPAPAVLAGNVDLNYPARDAAVPDTARAAEFVRDYGALIQSHRPPRFAYVALPGGDGSDASVADGDAALGTIVDFLSHGPTWHTTAIFVVSADPGAGDDHVDASRTFALIVSPWVKRGYVGMRHLSTAGVLKTIDRIFALPALSLGDLLAQDMGDFFTARPDRRPYEGTQPRADNDSARGEKGSP